MPMRSKSQWRMLWAKVKRGEMTAKEVREIIRKTPGEYKGLPERKK